ncbi:virion structural protein [Erwinia phage vB_EamM_EarlPhillipIV]|uniref:Virion structural protein n=1 Tax=Erwinia phage vB_EamM_EarlPhillipIV TaxID=1883372 RepID=A0A1B2ICS1_9CAUD|nr:virion structural protein [Erwinia phage vB_EamM_EarlPhillipIV]ANZ49014.1 hypothetical protein EARLPHILLIPIV_165 [Erwinia phage vB_EamM_EarlPhillipIV]
MTRYPYDPTGKATTNVFTEERILESNENTDRVIMLSHAPFFGALQIFNGNSTTPLDEGSDYEYVYELSALKASLATDAPPVYCGVQFINPEISGNLVFNGNLLGGDFYDPLTEILDYLIKYINNPRSASYRSLNGVPALFPQKPSYTSWADAKNKQYTASAVDDVAAAVDADVQDLKTDLQALTRQANQLFTDIEAFNYPAHIAATDPHSVTPTQLNAHPVGLEVPDTFLAYGKNLRELIENIRSQGLSDADIQLYLHRYLSKNVKGTFQFADGATVIADSTNTTKLILSAAKIQLITQGGIVAAAGTDLSGAKYVEYVCGTNTLRVTTNGTALGVDKLTLNGVALLTGRTVKKYQSKDVNGDPENVQINISSTNMTFKGKGTPSAPLEADLNIPKATKALPGKVKLVTGPGAVADGVAATPASGKPYNDGFNDMVPKTLLINNKPMSGAGITLDKGDLNLGSVDNTADLNKPLSTPQKARTDALVAKDHKHDWSMLQIGQATRMAYGTVKIASQLSEVEDGQAVAPAVLKALNDRLADINKRFFGVMYKDTLEFTTVESVTFNVSGWNLTPTTAYRYFVARALDSAEGTFDGVVNLAAVPSGTWYYTACGIENNWNAGVVHNTQPANPLPQAVAVSTANNRLGGANVRLAAKVRLRFTDDIIKIRVRSAGKVSIWVDENPVIEAATDPNVEIELLPGVHAIAILSLCEDTTKPASIAFDVMDGATPVYNSSAATKVGTIANNLPTANMRFFIYGNVTLGKFQAVGAPVPSDSLNTEMLYLGYVDTNATAVITSGGPIQFNQVIDFGQFRELQEHIADQRAHGGIDTTASDYSPADVKVPGLEITEPYGVADKSVTSTPSVAMFSNTAGMALRTQGTLVVAEGAAAAGGLRVWVGVKGQSPYRWKNMANPQAKRQVTYDGSFMSNESGILEFVAAPVNGKHEVLSLFAIDIAAKAQASIAFVNEVTPQPVALPYVEIPRTNLVPFVRAEDVEVAASFNFPTHVDGTSIKKPRVLATRYRYIPAEKRLNILIGVVDDDTRVEVHRFCSLVFEQDISRFFEGPYVGYASSSKLGYRIMGSIFDCSIPTEYLSRLNYHTGLIKSYIRGSELSAYAAKKNGLQRGRVGFFLGSEMADVDIATQVILTEETTNILRDTASYAVPHGLWTTGSRESTFGVTPVLTDDFLNPGTDAGTAIGLANLNRRGYAATHIEPGLLTNAKTVSVNLAGQGVLSAWVDGLQVAKSNQAGAVGNATATINYVPSANFKGYFTVTTEPTAGALTCFVKAKFIITYNDNTTKTLETNVANWYAYEFGKIPMIAMQNPWNLTQRNWDFVVTQLNLEKE